MFCIKAHVSFSYKLTNLHYMLSFQMQWIAWRIE